MHIPRVMSTQHPDNVEMPFFAKQNYFDGEDEIKEAYYVFSHLGIEEQMWDFEGKEVDDFVVKKLLSTYPEFFSEKVIGLEVRITPRVPNPEVERDEAKLLAETLEMIPRSFDYARKFYDDPTPPIFEIIVPMVTKSEELERIYLFYRDFVAGKSKLTLADGTRVGDWLGEFEPETIGIIPLFEDIPGMLKCDAVVREFADGRFDEMRVFLARSDPALNYGFIPATLAAKIALQRLYDLEIDVYPIIGVGCPPFRGSFDPENMHALEEYPSVQTFTAQSAFKYDYDFNTVFSAVMSLKESMPGKPDRIETSKDTIDRLSGEYRKRIPAIAEFVNEVGKFVPKRRMRKLHIGLFGYSRGDRIRLPRAITFCAVMYSIGFPPELIGISALGDKDYENVCESIPTLESQMEFVLSHYNPESLKIVPFEDDIKRARELFDFEPREDYLMATSRTINSIRKQNGISDAIIETGKLRRFLG
ncbi:phosphoenolpyruvate carboxylase [Geoglobus acetivorans]|uniref:Phosphoenolpyruvate carboxylase n=1 Tax=Geoglobus acetivorans TaxID=565033 RepID=A0ABZ3H3R1_GEOAI|nr:phosphoenolpyruvate carboxylase [Geoglobus acetivorans]